ncbi:outer membrane protein [Bartonella sp. 1-1C]|uniref:outer membrane protein n=1 Tax=Bartonella sp. 1-1C TaxID=515256 RepID=UPI0001F4BA52|nr:outer membrane beta-barrel protein [Bartonella sp. 1-1C]ATO57716.1 Outer membrane protein beta-barrel domain-containing protein [Bartonella sp. 1-1C]CBI80516.1 putative Hemin binding protein b [Bartonella sp. 1-1C]
MRVKYLIAVPVLIVSLSVGVQASDTPTPSGLKLISAPFYSWGGFYFGGQIGSFSSSTTLQYNTLDETKKLNLSSRDFTSEFSGGTGGFYAGVNFEYGNRFVLGVDTDIVFSNKQNTKVFSGKDSVRSQDTVLQERSAKTGPVREMVIQTRDGQQIRSSNSGSSVTRSVKSTTSQVSESGSQNVKGPLVETVVVYPQKGHTYVYYGEDAINIRIPPQNGEVPLIQSSVTYPSSGVTHVYSGNIVQRGGSTSEFIPPLISDEYIHILKRKWFGATRIRLGLSVGRVMPYIAGGVAYAKVQGIFKKSIKIGISKETVPLSSFDSEEIMTGYTLGGGFDFAVTDRILLRAEYRYSDFGAKEFKKVDLKDYNANDFRIGLAYKF